MSRFAKVAAVLGAVGLLFTVPIVRAQTEDHLKCYKVQDPLRLKGLDVAGDTLRTWLDLTPQQFASFNENCKIVGGLRYFCAPVEKKLDASVDKIMGKHAGVAGATWSEITLDPTFSGPSEGDKICYKIKCDPKFLNDNKDLSITILDQFGARDVTKIKPFLLCGPAQKDCGDCRGPGGCAHGWCPNSTDVCQADPADPNGCVCATPGGSNPPLCASASAPTCNGLCPPGTICQQNAAGVCQCHCPSLGCTNLSPPMCANGFCPNATDTCATTPSACQCFAAGACQLNSPAPACGGTCANSGDVCQVDPSNPSFCVCASPSGCTATSPPLCGGPCPAPQSCVINAGVCQCLDPATIHSDHYRLYFANGAVDPPLVNLGDQFLPDIQDVDLGPVNWFAVPASKNDGESVWDILYPNTHGTWYQVPPGHAYSATIGIANQFGEQTLTISTLDFLFVPAQKIEPPMGPAERLEHYNCYKATGQSVNRAVIVTDQFSGPDEVTVGTPTWFCAPARKNTEEAEDQLHHLTCYEAPGGTPPSPPVLITDQFGSDQELLMPAPSSVLCVPSFKLSVQPEA